MARIKSGRVRFVVPAGPVGPDKASLLLSGSAVGGGKDAVVLTTAAASDGIGTVDVAGGNAPDEVV